MSMIKLFSPAKINLFLRVIGKRLDGFHELSSVFQTISLGDSLSFSIHDTDHLTCSNLHLPTDPSNLVLKAVELFRQKTGISDRFKIHLEKHIPTQAGLGGGSSNAATTLWACNQLTNANIPVEDLQDWSIEIGSDIPFFFSEGTAYCTGRGEHVLNLPKPNKLQLTIVKPKASLSTAEVFKKLAFKPNAETINDFNDLQNFLNGELNPFNDLETVVREINPELGIIKSELMEAGFKTVVLTGTGSAFYCLGELKKALDPSLQVFPVQYINRTPSQWFQT